jgi:hypothetical protein
VVEWQSGGRGRHWGLGTGRLGRRRRRRAGRGLQGGVRWFARGGPRLGGGGLGGCGVHGGWEKVGSSTEGQKTCFARKKTVFARAGAWWSGGGGARKWLDFRGFFENLTK